MTNQTAITLFDTPQLAPVYLQTSAAAKALAEQMEGGLAGRQINRLSLRNGKFRFIKQGVEIAVLPNPTLDVVVVAANPAVGRLWWEAAFDSDQAGQRPDCYSRDGKSPEMDSPKRQSDLCATCPRNAVGSAANGKGKACSYKKRVIIVAPGKIDGDAYALDAGAMTMFGDDQPAQRQFNLKSYIETLKANGLIVPAVITRLSFDDAESVPKLFMTPVRVLTPQEFAIVEARLTDPAIREMLDDIDLKSEAGKPIGAPAPVAQVAAPASIPVAQLAPAPVAQPVAPPAAQVPAPAAAAPRTRGRPRTVEATPAPASAPQAAPVAPEGFGFPAPTAAAAPAPVATASTAPPPGFSVDLDQFDA